ncbi:hypothetical protein [Microbacterium sp. SSM24]|uniref:hypothetical protein n=1 Tax=Microbacterium sp. SSM24 TaxID=2991714 RepID=UPI002226223D|nr:hypothetical protein [Microbacterium sp. SSM24]MCW3494736.1 hypothetical protein [Microbacterium sp. SSM24]
MTDDQLDEDFDVEEPVAASEDAPQYGVGPFSIREVAIAGVWLVAFVVSFFSINVGRFESVWTSAILWILAIAVPTVAVFLLALRRLSPQGIRRVGSLGIDQFASVAFSVAALVWLQLIWETVEFAIETGAWARTWVIWVEAVLMLAGVVLTVFAPVIPVLCEDFRGRPEVPAHRSARPIRPVSPRPARAPRASEGDAPDISAFAPAPVAPSPYAASDAANPAESVTDTSAFAPAHSRDTFERVEEPSSTVEPAAEPARQQAFWALVPEERDVVDEIGIPVFRIGPTAWALVIEDRGEAFVVRHEDGRIGYLHDVSDVTRG